MPRMGTSAVILLEKTATKQVLTGFTRKCALSPDSRTKLQMKRKLITLTAAFAMTLATISITHAEDPATKDLSGNRPHHRWANGLERMTETLNLTPEQQAKIRPILERATPQ